MAQQKRIRSFADLFALWKTAGEYGRGIGVDATQVRTWKKRNTLPPEYWRSTVDFAHHCGHLQVTLELLAQISEARGRL